MFMVNEDLQENQNTILEESRLERAKHNAIVDALEKVLFLVFTIAFCHLT